METVVDIIASFCEECMTGIVNDSCSRLSYLEFNRSNFSSSIFNSNLRNLADVEVIIIGRVYSEVNLSGIARTTCDDVALKVYEATGRQFVWLKIAGQFVTANIEIITRIGELVDASFIVTIVSSQTIAFEKRGVDNT